MSLRKPSLQALAAAHTATCTSPKRSCRGHPHLAGEVDRDTWHSLEGTPDCSTGCPTLPPSSLPSALRLRWRYAWRMSMTSRDLSSSRRGECRKVPSMRLVPHHSSYTPVSRSSANPLRLGLLRCETVQKRRATFLQGMFTEHRVLSAITYGDGQQHFTAEEQQSCASGHIAADMHTRPTGWANSQGDSACLYCTVPTMIPSAAWQQQAVDHTCMYAWPALFLHILSCFLRILRRPTEFI